MAELAMPRKMWRTLEPLHGLVYFAPEAAPAYAAIGIEGRSGYFASRSAAMGPVPAEVVVATFFNFHPALVHRAMAGVWERATPDQVLAARLDVVDQVLRRVLGDVVSSPAVEEAAELAATGAGACSAPGRPLYAGHASLPWPEAPHLRLWHAVSLLREFRGDGHVAALVAEGVDGCEALVLHGASGEVAPEVLRTTRAWSEDEWAAACDRLRERGWLDDEGGLTEAGSSARTRVEERTDELATAPWDHLGAEACVRLRELARPWSRAVVDSGTFGFRPG